MSANNEEHGAEKLGRGAATVAKYGREYMRELGRRGNAAKRERRQRIHDLLARADSGDHADKQLAEDARVVQWELEQALKAKDYEHVHQMRQDALNRLRGRPAQTHLVAVQQTVKLSEDEIRHLREATDKIIEHQIRENIRANLKIEAEERARLGLLPISPARESEIVAQYSARWSGPAPAEPGAPASAESPRDLDTLPEDVNDRLLRANGITLPGHPLPPAPPRDPQPRRSGPGNARSR